MGLQIKTKTSIGNLFTAVSILLSFIGVSIGWYQDRLLEEAIQASKNRGYSTEAYSKIMDWQALTLNFYNNAEILIEEVAIEYADSRDNIGSRDRFWLGITLLWNELEEEILNRSIRTYHLKLLSYNLDHDSTFVTTVNYIDRLNELNRKAYMDDMQDVILAQDPSDGAETAILGNKLRGVNRRYREKTRELYMKQTTRLDNYLQMILTQSNRSLVR